MEVEEGTVGSVLVVKVNGFKRRLYTSLVGGKGSVVIVSGSRTGIESLVCSIAGIRVNSYASPRMMGTLKVGGFSLVFMYVNAGFRDSLRVADLIGRVNKGCIVDGTGESIRTGFLLQGNTSRIVCPSHSVTREITGGCDTGRILSCITLGSSCSVCRVGPPRN